VETKLQRIAEKARRDPKCRFTSLFHLMNMELLLWVQAQLSGPGADFWSELPQEPVQVGFMAGRRNIVTMLHICSACMPRGTRSPESEHAPVASGESRLHRHPVTRPQVSTLFRRIMLRPLRNHSHALGWGPKLLPDADEMIDGIEIGGCQHTRR
jgi:hypothetical protein